MSPAETLSWLTQVTLFAAKFKPGGSWMFATRLSASPLALALDRMGDVYLTGWAVEGFRATTGVF